MDEFKKDQDLPEETANPAPQTETEERDALLMLGGVSDGGEEPPVQDEEDALDKNVRLLSPGRMVARRFFRSKLSIIGLVMIIALLIFSWFGPVVYNRWGEKENDMTPSQQYSNRVIEVMGEDGTVEYTFLQSEGRTSKTNDLALPSKDHILGTDDMGMDVFTRLMYGGRISLSVSFIAVFAVTFIGIVFGGLAGYFGGKVDEVIMRICDILMCLPSLPLMLILGTLFDAWTSAAGKAGNTDLMDFLINYRIHLLMLFLSLISWGETARLVRGQILFLREQEYMVAAEAMGFSTSRKIFKHLIPNVLPQLIVSMTLSLGSMILQEATLSYLGLGVGAYQASWGTMINVSLDVLKGYFNVWGPPGFCIIAAVLGFNFIGDGLRDALDPKARR